MHRRDGHWLWRTLLNWAVVDCHWTGVCLSGCRAQLWKWRGVFREAWHPRNCMKYAYLYCLIEDWSYLPRCISVCLSVHLSVSLSVCLSVCLFICLSVWWTDWLTDWLSAHLSMYPSICPSACPSTCLPASLLIIMYVQVSRLAGVIQHVCQKAGCQVVLDIGSGLVSHGTHWENHHTLLWLHSQQSRNCSYKVIYCVLCKLNYKFW